MIKILMELNKFCEDVLIKYNDLNKIDLMKIDLLGWNIVYYVLMFGRFLILELIDKK